MFSGEPLHDAYDRSLPSGTGYDFAGTIVARGARVAGDWLTGDRVFGDCASTRKPTTCSSIRSRWRGFPTACR
ncbi:alcohol dehydrogenase catalytic domain-containing protein [Microbacterium sp. 1.5R]|uniref:alcohol dehydrogenase catalytic domain-containing protein n=1 Tax=Microbacterium sp. 1.5R TaxID=1916917 RepID=UPI0037CB956B